MKLSALLPVYAVSTFAFVIPPTHSPEDAIAGSIGRSSNADLNETANLLSPCECYRNRFCFSDIRCRI